MSLEETLDSVELVTRPTESTQFYLFNLFGDYIVPLGGQIWTNDLLYLLDLLDVSERAARTALSRMRRQGWFETTREGRETRYALTESGQAILAEGDRRIFEEPLQAWDGRWHMVVYSLPEEKRSLRNELRKKLIWYGFGNLAPGTWVTPHKREEEVKALLADLEAEAYATLFVADSLSDADIVRQCWDIDALARDYQQFVDKYEPELRNCRERLAAGETLPAEECFVRRFWLTYDFQRFPRKDPNLPVELLPPGWVGHRARALVLDYRKLLTECMGDFIEQTVLGKGS